MPLCPSCGTELNADFGMVACLQCRAISVIDMDGNIQLDNSAASDAAASGTLDLSDPSSASAESFAAGAFDMPTDSFSESPQSDEAFDFGQMNAAEPGADLNSAEGEGESLESIADFGNSEQSSARDGMYVFDVSITGIDTKELREAVRSSLDDRRFLWDVSAIMARIHKGTLLISSLNPVKTTILVNRLKGLPLDVQWKQNTIINT